MSVEAGQRAELIHTVTADDTATAMGSGDVEVLATPRLLAWCEAATLSVLAGHLEQGQTSVGMRVSIDHLAPSVVGAQVHTGAELEKVEGRRLTFVVWARADDVDIAAGRVVRVLVDRQRFLDRA